MAKQTKTVPIPVPPDATQVLVVIVPLDTSGAGWQACCAELPNDEQERTRRFKHDTDRLRFAKCRCLLRRIIASWQDILPAEVSFRFGKNGKPFLSESRSLQFNISHTRGCAIFAFCQDHEIGIDIEHTDRNADIDGISGKVFTTRERDMLMTLGRREKRREFFRLWTAKEAFMKATGRGFSLDPASIEACLPENHDKPGTFLCKAVETAGPLLAREVPAPVGYQAMLCAPRAALSRQPSITSMDTVP